MKFLHPEGILKKINVEKKKNQILFLGSIYLERTLHGERASYINYLITKKIDSLKIYSNVSDYNFINYSKNFIFKMLKISNYKDFDVMKELIFYSHMYNIAKINNSGTFFGLEQFKKINENLIILNKHINGVNYPANIRLFEVTGLGSCLLTDHYENISELFEIDNEIITYKSKDELTEKINYLRSHVEIAETIGKNAQAKVIKKHSYKNRIYEFENIILKGV